MTKYIQQNINAITDISSYDERRVVFVSLNGLFRTWKQCPSMILYHSMLIMPLKKKWIYNPSKYENEFRSNLFYNLSNNQGILFLYHN